MMDETRASRTALSASLMRAVHTRLDPDRGSDDVQRVRATVATVGEPWVSGFDPSRLAEDLRGVGLVLVEDLDGEGLRARYCAGRTDGLSPASGVHIARARVGASPA